MKIVRTLAIAFAIATPATAMAADPIIMHRDPGCGCCEQWARQAEVAFKRDVRTVDNPRRDALKARIGIPASLASCHTAIVDGMAFEGHVPVADMKRALASRPKGIKGLAVAEMPLGSPGMEMPGMQAQRYNVIAFGPSGQKVFARH